MKLITDNTLFLILLIMALVIPASSAMAQVYKVVDENGNVTYTDQPPGDGSKPVELAPISVIETPEYKKTARELAAEAEAEARAQGKEPEAKEESLRTLRARYRDFAIISPQQEEAVWSPEGPVSIAWNTGTQLMPGMKVAVTVDGKRLASGTERLIMVPGLERGEHTVGAELTDSRNRRVATAQPVTFFIRQPGLYNRVRPVPGGGG
ncbi:MAG: DUF4124 domain-containing protein [Xanthomonadales bacterium]|nr:DUF4124 domain-containing protein [Gammaproteobacteria bacterium]MBT8072764.1 DUF4124 domain-containing protein [Gammaproteobacteria bacterium]MBT8075527.1 DUF4124 domain-containing protein [Gammaproteobacteria bacterium]NNK03606.1 DUF4124 domain-containing protein [Xanthomonadales bacterium]NNK97431.1 DUF4124 domain-containing protein [Xanthomonadales bacterium]